MTTSLFPAPVGEASWGEGSRELLNTFFAQVANTRLKVRILSLFLNEPGLCLSSVALAKRVSEPVLDTQLAARELGEEGALHYCAQFAHADLCSQSLPFLAPAMRLQLGLLRFALRHEPNWVWNHFAGGEVPLSESLSDDRTHEAAPITDCKPALVDSQ